MFVYGISPAANVATNGTANTDTDHLRLLTGSARGAFLLGLYLQGKGAGLTAIRGIIARLARYTTPSTAGAALVPQPRMASAPAATTTASTGPTVGTTQTVQLAVGCGAAGPGGWVAPNPEAAIQLEAAGGAKGNLDLISQSGTISLNFEYSAELGE
jgi:hypothetical protein